MDIHVPSQWKKIVAIGCTHGHMEHPVIVPQALAFIEAWNPEYRVHLGDVVDTTAFRAGAHGTTDEAADPTPDVNAAAAVLKRMQPTHFTEGNHDHRLQRAMHSPSAIVQHSARLIWDEITGALPAGCKVTPYHIRHNWVRIGGHYWGHGFMYNMQAVRDHAEMLGGPVVMAHLHRPESSVARTLQGGVSYCVGTLADIDKMEYASQRRATFQWGHGLIYGYVSENKSQLWLAQSAPGELLPLPSV